MVAQDDIEGMQATAMATETTMVMVVVVMGRHGHSMATVMTTATARWLEDDNNEGAIAMAAQ